VRPGACRRRRRRCRGQAAALEPSGGRADADPDHHEIGRHLGAVRELHRLDPAGTGEPGHAHAETQVDPVVTVDRGADLTHLAPEGALERHVGGFEDGDVEPELAADRGDLGADEPGTDHDDPAGPGLEPRPHRRRVVEGAQGVDAGEAVGVGQRARRGAGGDDRPS
jgi:hypothetical protein